MNRGTMTRVFTRAAFAACAGLILVLVQSSFWAQSAKAADSVMETDIKAVEDFIEAFNEKDVDKIMGFFSADPVYHNMSSDAMEGTDAVRNLIASYVTPAEKINWEMLNISQSGNVVLAERIDRFVFGGKDVAVPVIGAFEMKDGKIVAWRDYFDTATWQKQMGN